jgi:hypothetical protein
VLKGGLPRVRSAHHTSKAKTAAGEGADHAAPPEFYILCLHARCKSRLTPILEILAKQIRNARGAYDRCS